MARSAGFYSFQRTSHRPVEETLWIISTWLAIVDIEAVALILDVGEKSSGISVESDVIYLQFDFSEDPMDGLYG